MPAQSKDQQTVVFQIDDSHNLEKNLDSTGPIRPFYYMFVQGAQPSTKASSPGLAYL